MKITQLSVFLENVPGKLTVPCRVLAGAGVNIMALSLADTNRFGVLRLIVDDPPAALKALETGLVDVSPLVTHSYNLEDLATALEEVRARKGDPIKPVVRP